MCSVTHATCGFCLSPVNDGQHSVDNPERVKINISKAIDSNCSTVTSTFAHFAGLGKPHEL